MAITTSDYWDMDTAHFGMDNPDQWAGTSIFEYYDSGFKQFCIAKLEDLENLEANWDYEGAPPINRDILEAAQKFVNSLPSNIATRPMVVPLSSGHVQLEWHHGNVVLELELESPNSVHYLKWDPNNQIEEEDVIPISNRDELIGMIRWFMRRMLSGK